MPITETSPTSQNTLRRQSPLPVLAEFLGQSKKLVVVTLFIFKNYLRIFSDFDSVRSFFTDVYCRATTADPQPASGLQGHSRGFVDCLPKQSNSPHGIVELPVPSREFLGGDPRDQLIRETVFGRSFADVGGLWRVTGEKVSVASRAGATELSMFDEFPPDDPQWQGFKERMSEFGIGKVSCLSADILTVPTSREFHFDVVHCSGVLYHFPDPIRLLARLHDLTGQHLILTSLIVSDHIENEWGTVTLPASGSLFIPALSDTERKVLTAFFDLDSNHQVTGITSPAHTWSTSDYGFWWWLFTETTLIAMCQAVGFKVVHSTDWNSPRARTLLLTKNGSH